MKILIIEDESALAAIVKDYLVAAGYQVHSLGDGGEALAHLAHQHYDLVVLDLMLPHVDGIEICQFLQQHQPECAIIMTTAKVEEVDRLLGLAVGADDYLCKPFSPRELVARVKAIFRRARLSHSTMSTTDLQLKPDQLQVGIGEQWVQLTLVEFNLLARLMAHPGRIYSREQLMDSAYEDQRVVSDRTIDSHVKKLRKKLEAIAPAQQLVRSVYGAGYQFDPVSGN